MRKIPSAGGSEGRAAVRAVAIVSLLLPLLFLSRTAMHPATNLVAARPQVIDLDDPTTNATVMARAWARWDGGDFRLVDDRVFAPAPNALALGDNFFLLPALVGYPFARLAGSIAAGVNAFYFLALVSFPLALYGLLSRLAAPGWASALLAIAVAWGPGRMNTLGVVTILFTAYGLLAASFALDWLRGGRPFSLVLVATALFLEATGSLYGIAMGGIWAAAAVLLAAPRGSARRVPPLLLSAGAGLGAACLLLTPYFRIHRDFGAVTGIRSFEQHAADLLSLLHGGIFGGPVAAALRALVPGFPVGAAAFFPTLLLTAALLLYAGSARARRVPGAGVAPWLVLAAAIFLLALGPTVRLAGRPLAPGPYRLLLHVPVLSSVRGIHRLDQWFDVTLGVAAAVALARLRGARALGKGAAFALVGLAVLDVWPASVGTFAFPHARPAAVAAARSLPRDAVVAVLPWTRTSHVRSWVDQLAHGRRVTNGWLTFAPPVHDYLAHRLPRMPVPTRVELMRDLGASLVQVDLDQLDPSGRAAFEALAAAAPAGEPGLLRAERSGDLLFLFFAPRRPILVTDGTLSALRFHGTTALLGFAPGRAAFRIGAPRLPVTVEEEGRRREDELAIPLVMTSPASLTLSRPLEPGAIVRDAATGRVLGAAF